MPVLPTGTTIKKLIVPSLIPNIADFSGHYFPESHFSHIITTNTDVYGIPSPPVGEPILLLKFRKRVIPQSVCCAAYYALYKHAQRKNYNRGAASGLLTKRKLPAFAQKLQNVPQKYRAYYKNSKGILKKTHISNIAQSNIAGYYDRPSRYQVKKDGRAPPIKCRITEFTAKNPEKWAATLPLLRCASNQFKKLVPQAYKRQMQRATQTAAFQIPETAFSTITVNYDWQTACHTDKGDFMDGYGNLIVLEKQYCCNTKSNCTESNGYKGGYIGFPQWGIAVDVRQGDFLAMDVHQWHCNTEIIGSGRLSIVCYLRNDMIKCM